MDQVANLPSKQGKELFRETGFRRGIGSAVVGKNFLGLLDTEKALCDLLRDVVEFEQSFTRAGGRTMNRPDND